MTVKPRPTKLDLAQLNVVIPYPLLVELLQAPAELAALREELHQVRGQTAALRNMFSELLELYGTYND